MRDFTAYLKEQRPLIARELARQVDALPESARPVAAHVTEGGGKYLRPVLLLLFVESLGGDPAAALPLAAGVELLHCATLLHDDVMDNASLRRGRPAAHTIFGVTRAVLGGDALLALANLVVARYSDPRLTACLARATMETSAGQLREIDNTGNVGETREEYLAIIEGKTASLLGAACGLGAMFAGAPDALTEAAERYGRSLGMAFQMIDDALDFSLPAETGKPFGGDVREYKCTLPLLLYFQSLPEARAREECAAFAGQSMTAEQIDRLVAAVRDGGFAARARREATAYLEEAACAIRGYPDNGATHLLREAVRFVGQRTM